MRRLHAVRQALRTLFRRQRAAHDLDRELRFHLDEQIAEHLAAGMSRDQAQRAALRALGSSTLVREQTMDTWGWATLHDALRDLAYSTRTFRKAPLFTAAALLTLTLGIGATTAVFSVVDAVLLRPLPYPDPQRIVTIFEDLGEVGYPRTRVSAPTYLDLVGQQGRLFDHVAALNETSFMLRDERGVSRTLAGALVTADLFAVLGVEPMLGTGIRPEEDRPGANHVVLLSYALWQSAFGGDPGVVGRTVHLNDDAYAVKGVMPPGFAFPDKQVEPMQLWVPRAFTADELGARTARYLIAVARLRAGVSRSEVDVALGLLARHAIAQDPRAMRGVSRFFAEPLQESYVHEAKRGLVMLMLAVGFILLIACANVATLLLSRAAGRRREMVVRAALGASAGRLRRQLLAESALLAAFGGLIGTATAIGSFGVLRLLIPADLARTMPLTVSLPVLAFSLLVTVTSSVLFGVAPAWQLSRVDLNDALRSGGRTQAGSRSRLRDLFVASEIALSLVLLIGAGLVLKSLWNLQHVDTGFQADHVLTLDFALREPAYRDANVRTRFLEAVLASARSLPGVQSAGLAGGLPLASKGGLRQEVTTEGGAWRDRPATGVYRVISPGFLETLRIPVIRGRRFDARDNETSPPVALINRTAARLFWPGQDPIGKRLKLGNAESTPPWLEVVGVTGDIQEASLDTPPRLEVYCPARQSLASWQWPRFLVLRTIGDPLAVRQALNDQVARLDPEEPLENVMLLADIVEGETTQTRMQAVLLSGLASLALIMACVGIYGVMVQVVTQRTREIGIRTALGARPREVAGLVLRQGTRLTLTGVAAGLIAALLLARLMESLLFGVSPLDPLTFATVPTILTLIALAACYLPARRAARIDPTVALRRD